MHELLADIRQRLANKEYHNEEHVRLSLVARVVQALGWDIWNPTEVYTEFKATKKEDNTRVDVALFTHDFEGTAVFIECKAVGAFAADLAAVEKQLRDYNRDHTALFTVITDGRHWRFYFSFTSGEFKDKLFCKFDVQQDGLEEVAGYLETFLHRDNILNHTARHKAEAYLMLGKKERAMQDVLPDAQKLVSLPPFPSLPQAMVQLLAAKVLTITPAEAQAFLMGGTMMPGTGAGPELPAGGPAKTTAKPVAVAKLASSPNQVPPAAAAAPALRAAAASVEFVLVLNRLGIRATADWDPATRQLRVRAGSTAMPEDRGSIGLASAALRKRLLQQQILVRHVDRLEFQQDYLFGSIKQAAEVVCGYSVNGKQAWRDAADKPLADYLN
ncbi:DUF4357 domain-containing protein [Hymenobacter ruricola]|uniref:DUF4357 domain-containing protein n=1 Tax=Hymenobacter ruricola TaxID=2791023 RepID=A0ABS0I647_9BACT|nr:DUF4357 domain-containing protein [Hymenobacter ruricola]MBF9222231.1 DUF4357 domain-containing protein [Hymenobacter ruricola]